MSQEKSNIAKNQFELTESAASSRRSFLSAILISLGSGFALYFLGPLLRFGAFPFEKMPKEPLSIKDAKLREYLNMPINSVLDFKYGPKIGLMLKNENAEYIAFSKKCTHANCNIQYKPDDKKFFCACHEGWYDSTGKNIKGPPPRPLNRFDLQIVKTTGTNQITEFIIRRGNV